MNIHFFHPDPTINARYLDDRRRNKMIIENLQMMASALRRHESDHQFVPINNQGKTYGNSHPNHPSTIWTGDSRSNLLWLCDYTEALYARYKKAGGKAYMSMSFNLQRVREGALRLPDKGLTEFVNCARSKNLGIDYTDVKEVFTAYQLYMQDRWENDTITLTWSGNERV